MRRVEQNNLIKSLALLLAVTVTAAALCSCTQVRDFFRKKVDITFVANGGELTEKYIGDEGTAEESKVRCFVGDKMPGKAAEKRFYKLDGWYTEPENGIKVAEVPEGDMTVYAHWVSANKNRKVEITDLKTDSRDNTVRISKDEDQNTINVTFRLSAWYGQDVAFVNKKGKVVSRIDLEVNEDDFTSNGYSAAAVIPDRKWMNRKTSSYYIQSFSNDHVDDSKITELKISLDGQCEYFDEPIEGSMVWYGGEGKAPADRAGIVTATDDDFVYAERDGKTYKWEKTLVMINMADVRTDIVYDIYNAYSSRFFPIKGKCMYMDNGKKGLKRYEARAKGSAMHENQKIGQTTFMVPVQWDFAEKVAKAQSLAREAGCTLYIADSFRPAASVDPVARKVKNASLLAYGGTSAHNFGTAIDTGWQKVDKDGEPVGEPFVKNLQALDKKKAVAGPNGNRAEAWWKGVNKLPQEWWHYGDSTLSPNFKAAAVRVRSLYVNQGECLSVKRSKMK